MEINRNAPVCVESEIEIAAPIEAVWDVLKDVDAWPRWLSMGKAAGLTGPLVHGTVLWMKARGIPGTLRVRLDRVEEPHVLEWQSRTAGMFTIRNWRLESTDEGTRVWTAESSEGPPVRLLGRPMKKMGDSMMEKWLRELKAEVDSRAQRDAAERKTMAIKLHRCPVEFAKFSRHACWKVEKALIDAGIEYEVVADPMRKSKRTALVQATGQTALPAIEFEDGSWYRDQSAAMAREILAGRLDEHRGVA